MSEIKSQMVVKILERIKAEYGSSKMRDNQNTVQNLRCPVCGDLSAWCYSESPWAINCNRANTCGTHSRVKDLFSDMFRRIEETCPAVPKNPDLPAQVYLENRGLRQSLLGLDFKYWRNVRGLPTGAVMFPVGKDKSGKLVYNGRLFDPPTGEGKTHNSGSTSGLFWSHSGRRLDPEKEVFITEGVLDALSLIECGFQSIAVLSSGQDPVKLRLDGFKNIVTAFDHDRAGIAATKKWMKVFKDRPGVSISAVFPDPGSDWNSLLTGAAWGECP